jgi:hypothetical protein
MPRLRPALRLVLAMTAALWLAGSLARAGFALWFAPAGTPLPELAPALWLGIRFDLRVALVSMASAWLLASLPWVAPALSPPRARRFWYACWMLACTVWMAGAVFDAGHYAYLTQRLSSVLFSLARDGAEAVGMVWQSYPVPWILLGASACLLGCHLLFRRLWSWAALVDDGRPPARRWHLVLTELALVSLAVLAVHGRFSQYPLRWSDAVELPDPFARQLALNPLHNLADTWTFRTQRLDDIAMRPDVNEIRRFVGLPPLRPDEPISFLRTIPPKPMPPGRAPPNVVLVLLESFAAHKTGALGSPLGATPSFDALSRDGLLFTRMMSAHGHTARGVFATVTSMPDVSAQSTASRNPAATQQQSIVNEFKGYKKFYFIGGSTSWANVRGVLNASIDALDIYELGRLKSPSVDVWGVSDKNLFFEANELFREQKQPFFAIIQTSGNHRPYTIPDEDRRAFSPPARSMAELRPHGFISIKEYEAFAYLDWCIGQFMARARQEAYFDNTVFAFMGDHGIIGDTGPHMPPAWRDLAITQGHTPLLIYAPRHVAARRVDSWAQQVDVMPTLASLAGIGYRNTTLGRDLLDPQFDDSRVAFAFQFTGPGELGLLVGRHMLVDRHPPAVHDILSADPKRNLLEQPEMSPEVRQLQQTWSRFSRAYGNAALYLQTHNLRLMD